MRIAFRIVLRGYWNRIPTVLAFYVNRNRKHEQNEGEGARSLGEKDKQLADLNAKLATLNTTVEKLNTDVSTLTIESTERQKTIEDQTSKLHTAYYTTGTYKELETKKVVNKKADSLVLEKPLPIRCSKAEPCCDSARHGR